MTRITETATIGLDPETLWNEIGGFGSVGEWHLYRYILERASIPVRDYRGEFRIEPAGDAASVVIWSAQFELTEAGDGRTVESVRRFLHAGTESLRRRFGEAA